MSAYLFIKSPSSGHLPDTDFLIAIQDLLIFTSADYLQAYHRSFISRYDNRRRFSIIV